MVDPGSGFEEEAVATLEQYLKQPAVAAEEPLDRVAELEQHIPLKRDVVPGDVPRLAALHRTDDDVAALQAAFADFEAAGRDVGRLEAADRAFHLRLLQATRNELMMRLDVVVVHALDARNRIQHLPGVTWVDPVPDHRRVLDAVIAGDADGAERAMRHVIRESDDDLRSGEPPFDPAA